MNISITRSIDITVNVTDVHLNNEFLNLKSKVIKEAPTLNSAAVSIFVVILVELTNTNTNTNTVFVNSTNISTNIETAVLSRQDQNMNISRIVEQRMKI